MEYLFAIFLHNYPNLSARRPAGYLGSNPTISGIFLKFPSVLSLSLERVYKYFVQDC